MAKIALIFLLFALFAVTMAARVTREEATAKPLTFETIKENVDKLLNSPQAKEFAEGAKTLGNELLELAKNASKTLNENIQSAKPVA